MFNNIRSKKQRMEILSKKQVWVYSNPARSIYNQEVDAEIVKDTYEGCLLNGYCTKAHRFVFGENESHYVVRFGDDNYTRTK